MTVNSCSCERGVKLRDLKEHYNKNLLDVTFHHLDIGDMNFSLLEEPNKNRTARYVYYQGMCAICKKSSFVGISVGNEFIRGIELVEEIALQITLGSPFGKQSAAYSFYDAIAFIQQFASSNEQKLIERILDREVS